MKIIFDIGATNTRIGSSVDGLDITGRVEYATPADYKTGFNTLSKSIESLLEGQTVESIVGGFPSMFRADRAIHNSTHLPGWSDEYLEKDLKVHFSIPTYVANDLEFVGRGEAVHGAGKDKNIVAYVTISTGVNAVKFVGGKLDDNALGFEVGHQVIDYNSDIVCESCGSHGDLDALVGGDSIQKRTGKRPQDIKDPDFWNEITDIFSVGIHNVILHFSPEVVVLGGSMMKDISIARVQKNLESSLTVLPSIPDLRNAGLGQNSGLHGALSFEFASN